MTLTQRLQILASSQRSRLAELAGLDELTPEFRAELDTLGTTHQDTESQLRAAIAADDAARKGWIGFTTMRPEHHRGDAALECRDATGSPGRLVGVILPAGRVAGDRPELFVGSGVQTPADGIALLPEHRDGPDPLWSVSRAAHRGTAGTGAYSPCVRRAECHLRKFRPGVVDLLVAGIRAIRGSHGARRGKRSRQRPNQQRFTSAVGRRAAARPGGRVRPACRAARCESWRRGGYRCQSDYPDRARERRDGAESTLESDLGCAPRTARLPRNATRWRRRRTPDSARPQPPCTPL